MSAHRANADPSASRLCHLFAAAAASASGRATYDGHLHASRPPEPLWRGASARRGALCEAVLSCLQTDDLDSREKAVHALKLMQAAGLLGGGTPVGGDHELDCATRHVPAALRQLGKSCREAADSGSNLARDSSDDREDCRELLELAGRLDATGTMVGNGGRTRATETVFHLEF